MSDILIVLAVVAVLAILGVRLVRRRPHVGAAPETPALPPQPYIDYAPGVGDDAEEPRDSIRRPVQTVTADVLSLPPVSDLEVAAMGEGEPAPDIPEPTRGRMARLRARLARSNTAIGARLIDLLGGGAVDAATWDEVEETLLVADLGVAATSDLLARLRERVAAAGTVDAAAVRALLREELLTLIDPQRDRSLAITGPGLHVVLIVGVNGTGKTTTTGKLARALVADGHTVMLAAADTFRAAAADQLQTWGDRVGVPVVRGDEGADPASVAYEAVDVAMSADLDVLVVDTAGRLHTKAGLMDELGKVKRVLDKRVPVAEVLLVIDATTGQNGLVQARTFAEVVDVTGIVLTKLDGTAKGGIVVAVQQQLGVPVKYVGLGEGPDDLAPFDPAEFVDALLA